MRSAPHTLIQQFSSRESSIKARKRRLIDAVRRRHAAHVIDHERQRQRADHRRQRHDVGRIEMQHHMPAAALDAVDHAVEHRHVGRAAQMLDEIEAHAAHAAGIRACRSRIAETVVDYGDAAIAFGVGRDAIEHRRVVGAMAARLHDHRTLDAKMRVQRGQHFLRRVFRRVAAVGRIRKLSPGPNTWQWASVAPGGSLKRACGVWRGMLAERSWRWL